MKEYHKESYVCIDCDAITVYEGKKVIVQGCNCGYDHMIPYKEKLRRSL